MCFLIQNQIKMTKFLLIVSLLSLCLFAQATPTPTPTQNPKQSGSGTALKSKYNSLIFKLDPNAISVFSEHDASVLRSFIEYSTKIASCDEAQKTLYAEADNSSDTKHVNIIESLRSKGYAVIQLSCSNETVVIQLGRYAESNDLNNSHVSASKPTLPDGVAPSCQECGTVTISKEVLYLFKDTQYSNELFINDANTHDTGNKNTHNTSGLTLEQLRQKINQKSGDNKKAQTP